MKLASMYGRMAGVILMVLTLAATDNSMVNDSIMRETQNKAEQLSLEVNL